MKINEKIKKLRLEKGWSQTQLANKMGIHPQNIGRYERGSFSPSVEALIKFAEVFGVSIDYLVNEELSDTQIIVKDKQLQKYIEQVDNLNEEDKNLIKKVIESVLVRNKVEDLADKKI